MFISEQNVNYSLIKFLKKLSKCEFIMSDEETETKYEPFSNKKMMGFVLGGIIIQSMIESRSWVQLYMTWGLKLSIAIVALIFAVYALWDALNDPLTGYLLDKSKRFTSKYGKRFPFIVTGLIGGIAMLILMYLPIHTNPVFAVIWIFCFLLAWDQFQTIAELSLQGLVSDRLRDTPQRAKYGSYYSVLNGIFGIIKGISIPIALGMFGGIRNPSAYFFTTIFVMIMLIVLLIPFLISAREPKEMIELRTKLDQEGKSSSTSFIKALKRSFKDKNWVTVVFTYLAFATMYFCTAIGGIIWAIDGLGLPIEIMALFAIVQLTLAFISVPFWMKLTKKIGARKTYLYGLTWLIVLGPVFLLFGWSLIPLLIIAGIIAIGFAGVDISFIAVYSEAIDNATVETGVREEASYLGVLRFFSATAIVWWTIIYLIVSTITGYDPAIEYSQANPPTLVQKIGLNAQVMAIPAVIMLIAAIIFYKFNNITKEVAMENKKKLLEMGL